MKSKPQTKKKRKKHVAPLAGAWIEIDDGSGEKYVVFVAPLAGAWIEIESVIIEKRAAHMSLPSRERGLKSYGIALLFSTRRSLPSRERGLKYLG